eukprot:CAMPEP_0177267344 /NCGR_PEP_ID=MMETSP0367-20130122/63199_1 /TAXON_ID=447022 ORGANISM="Scrippsiella hangoei-like, Strain SHHI-4" /NCGR_SAMPLE_ID=MMETSP0367 /ASSEMBLY_ACC=CAM_ASM_000362 /LENGTH=93 /DNA_ID=CAMNT_0018722837 /DNA_START=331 /DNA_END=612 /DNA_ORIENTATION=+
MSDTRESACDQPPPRTKHNPTAGLWSNGCILMLTAKEYTTAESRSLRLRKSINARNEKNWAKASLNNRKTNMECTRLDSTQSAVNQPGVPANL